MKLKEFYKITIFQEQQIQVLILINNHHLKNIIQINLLLKEKFLNIKMDKYYNLIKMK